MTVVLLTRPGQENDNLASRLAGQVAEIQVRPLIETKAVTFTQEDRRLIMDIDQQDAIIFVSKSAVRYSMPELETYWPQWPVRLNWFAVGFGTSLVLSDHGIKADYPAVAGSEGLLELSGLQKVKDLKVLIVRGVGGRELLASELIRRGAKVTYLEVYERRTTIDDDWRDLSPDTIVVVTSIAALDSLRAKLGENVGKYQLIVASPRIAAQSQDFAQTTIAAGASDQALYDAILESL